MDQITNEIRNKIKLAVKAKLQEIGAYVDEELPDYIMVQEIIILLHMFSILADSLFPTGYDSQPKIQSTDEQ